MLPSIPSLRGSVHHLLPIRDHPAQVSFAFGLQPHMPLISSVSNNPIVSLLHDPPEIRPVVVSVDRCIPDKAVEQDRRLAVLELEG